MTTPDIQAIQRMDPSNGIYIAVVGKGDKQHLEPKKMGLFGKIAMWLGISSASMRKVIDYVYRHPLNPGSNQTDSVYTLYEKIISFKDKHGERSFLQKIYDLFCCCFSEELSGSRVERSSSLEKAFAEDLYDSSYSPLAAGSPTTPYPDEWITTYLSEE